MGNLSRKRRLVGAAVPLVVLGAAALVYAAWTATGSGSGYAKAGTAQALSTVNASATTTTTLYPGVDGDLKIQIHNPNPYPVRVTDITSSGAATADASHATCVTTGVTFTNVTAQTIDVPASSDTTTTLTGKVHMTNASDNGCQGATFTIPVTLSGNSNAA